MNKILTVKDDLIVIDENVLSIPELKAVLDHYTETVDRRTAILALSYLHYTYDVESPYFELQEEERESTIRKDFRGNYNPKFDQVMIDAAEKMKSFETAVSRLVRACKINLDKISNYLEITEISTGKDGNLSEVIRMHEKMPIILKNFRAAERDLMAEVVKNRSQSKNAIDENDDSKDFE